jgi:hypothetical protein
MAETRAIIGGESSGGMAIRGHIQGKDGIYAAALLVEMLAVTGKSIAEIYNEIQERYGTLFFAEEDFATTVQNKQLMQQLVFDEKKLPEFSGKIANVSYTDGCKVTFDDGSWVICRFSGTEPLLRFAAEFLLLLNTAANLSFRQFPQKPKKPNRNRKNLPSLPNRKFLKKLNRNLLFRKFRKRVNRKSPLFPKNPLNRNPKNRRFRKMNGS